MMCAIEDMLSRGTTDMISQNLLSSVSCCEPPTGYHSEAESDVSPALPNLVAVPMASCDARTSTPSMIIINISLVHHVQYQRHLAPAPQHVETKPIIVTCYMPIVA